MITKMCSITVNGKTIEVAAGTKLAELPQIIGLEGKYGRKVICAKQNYKIKELNCVINDGDIIELYDMTSHYGNRVYLQGLILLTCYAGHKLYKDVNKFSVNHSADKAFLMNSEMKMTKADVEKLEKEMKYIVEQDINIERTVVLKEEAMEYFSKLGLTDKVELIRALPNSYVPLHKIGDYYSYILERTPIDTGSLNEFGLEYVDENTFAIKYPTYYSPDVIPEFNFHKNFMKVFEDEKEWCRMMKFSTASDINKYIINGSTGDVIRMAEKQMDARLEDICNDIKKRGDVKIILLSGPSSSGKTTTTCRLSTLLYSVGLTPKMISMDDFFVERIETPKKPNGDYDFECLEAIDIKLFNETFESLVSGKETVLPTFDFIEGKKKFNKKMKLNEGDILLIEGIHALNPVFLTNIDKKNKYKIYLSPLTGLNVDSDNRMSTTDNRLLRRMIRDARTRGYSAETTIKNWYSVRDGESKYIFPFQDEADVVFNTSLVYEYNLFATYAIPLLFSVPQDSVAYAKAVQLTRLLRCFIPIPSESIPADSEAREFIGGGCYFSSK